MRMLGGARRRRIDPRLLEPLMPPARWPLPRWHHPARSKPSGAAIDRRVRDSLDGALERRLKAGGGPR
jgi:hypothetical protein